MMPKNQKGNSQSGQSLIETLVAIFVLTMALSSALGLLIYISSTSALNSNEIIATNLAREGVEVIRMMRDTNWLEGDAKGGGWDLGDCADIGKSCYAQWLQGPSGSPYHNYDISESNNQNRWRLQFDAATRSWALENNNNYNLYLQNDGTYTHTVRGTSNFSRRIVISYCNAPTANCMQYTNANPEVIVKSVVAWRGKNCVWAGQDPMNATSNCKVTMEEHLTNWKDYK